MASEDFEFELPDYSEITSNGSRMLLERTIRSNGIWRIHKNDPDTIFPSDPHADRVDGPEKLDLYTGKVYNKLTKAFLRTLPPKAMKFIYNEIINSKETNIINKLLAKKEAITYL